MTRVSLSNIRFGYSADTPVLRGLHLEVEAGEIVGLLGRNGSGKTTTFRILTGLLRADVGTIRLNGITPDDDPVAVKKQMAFLPDAHLLYEQMSAEENMNMFSLLWGVDPHHARERSEALLHQAELWQVRQQWVESYSLGMKQRLSICAALLHDPSIIVMDEPFASLDVDSGLWGRAQLRSRADAGVAILFSSHVPELIEAISDSIAVLDQGVVVSKASIGEVKRAGGAIAYFGLKAPRIDAEGRDAAHQ
jgi:ABC-2 type transport system ATP-binding protein